MTIPDLHAALRESAEAARTARGETYDTHTPGPEAPGAVRDNEWAGIGYSAQAALRHAYWAEQDPDHALSTAASMGLPSMVKDGNITETPDGPRLTDRGRAVLAQGQVYGVRL